MPCRGRDGPSATCPCSPSDASNRRGQTTHSNTLHRPTEGLPRLTRRRKIKRILALRVRSAAHLSAIRLAADTRPWLRDGGSQC